MKKISLDSNTPNHSVHNTSILYYKGLFGCNIQRLLTANSCLLHPSQKYNI